MKICGMRAFLLFVAVFFLVPFQILTAAENIRTVVIFFALNPNLPVYQQFISGFKSSLNANKEIRSNVILEYCDIYRFGNSENIETLVLLYNEKYRTAKIDLLIIIGPGLHPYLEKYQLEMLKTTPTINVDFTNTLMSSDPLIARNELNVRLEAHVEKSVQSAIDLFPDYREIYVFSGNSNNDEYFLNLFKQIEPQFSARYSFKYITGIPFDSTLIEAGKVPAQSLVFVPSYLSDSKIPVYNTPEASSLIAGVTKAPVFPVFDSFVLSSGSIGGNVLSLFNIGEEVGRLSTDVLKGVPIKELQVDKSDFYEHTYNWEQLKSLGLLKSRAIPENSRMYYKKVSFFELYKWQIGLLFFFLVSQTLLIFYLIRLNKRQKEIVRQKIETENIYRQLTREDRLMRMVELTASLSHELSQPLTSILYSAQAGLRFLKSGKQDEKQTEEIFENIIEDDKRAGDLISSVKNMMKQEVREPEILNLNALIQEAISIFKAEAVRNNIDLKLSLIKNQVIIFGDKIQLQQVLLNFLFNAAIAMENVTDDSKTISIVQSVKGNLVTVAVRDSGPGIDVKILDTIFKPFVTTRKKGFGIGLALCKSIIEKHHGRIWASNILNGGAEFSFSLQIAENEK